MKKTDDYAAVHAREREKSHSLLVFAKAPPYTFSSGVDAWMDGL